MHYDSLEKIDSIEEILPEKGNDDILKFKIKIAHSSIHFMLQ